MSQERGILFVLSGPAGVGKGTVGKALRKYVPGLHYSISVTTRQPRAGERDGVDYFFKTKDEFRQMIKNNELLEWAEYVGNYYGTPVDFVEKTLACGKDVLLEIEVQGAKKVRSIFSEAVFIFLAPPSLEELRKRIETRGTETDTLIQSRMEVAKKEIAEMKHYDYVVENDEVKRARERIEAIVTAEHCRKTRVMPKFHRLLEVDER